MGPSASEEFCLVWKRLRQKDDKGSESVLNPTRGTSYVWIELECFEVSLEYVSQRC